jgi:hypothetical protein
VNRLLSVSPMKVKQGVNSSRGVSQSESWAKSPMIGQDIMSKQASINVNEFHSGSQFVPTKLDQWKKDNDMGNNKRIFEKEDLHLLDPNEERVQGLSGTDFNMLEDDLLSDETQGSQSVQQPIQDSYKMEKNKCADTLSLKEKNIVQMSSVGLKIIPVDEKTAKMNEVKITEKQKIPDTRYSERVQARLGKKGMNQAANPKKRSLLGTTLISHNSFAALNNKIIADIACDMGIDMSFSNFDSIDIMKDLEVARHSLKSINESKLNVSNVQKAQDNEEIASELPLLEWIDDDYEAEHFNLVQSKKRKRRGRVYID